MRQKDGPVLTNPRLSSAIAFLTVAAPAAKVATPKVDAIVKNGVRRPRAGGACDAVWSYLDEKGDCTVARIKEVAVEQGWNPGNAAIEIYQWRKHMGITNAAKAA